MFGCCVERGKHKHTKKKKKERKSGKTDLYFNSVSKTSTTNISSRFCVCVLYRTELLFGLLALSFVALLVSCSSSLERLLCGSVSGLPHLTELLDSLSVADVLVCSKNLSTLCLAEEQVGRARTLWSVSLLCLLLLLALALGGLLLSLLSALGSLLVALLLVGLLAAALGGLLHLCISDNGLLEEVSNVLDHVSAGATVDTKKCAELTKEDKRAAADARLQASTVVVSTIHNTAEFTKVLLDSGVLGGHAECKVVQSQESLVGALPGADLISDIRNSRKLLTLALHDNDFLLCSGGRGRRSSVIAGGTDLAMGFACCVITLRQIFQLSHLVTQHLLLLLFT